MFVSVIVPCYNHAPYLKQRIESILNQTYQNFELILLDDVSPDESAEILLSYKDHPKVSHCIINEKNSGSTFHQWNKGMALAQGELIWIAESDDAADLSFLETLVEPFQQNPNLVLAYSQSHRMDSQGNITGTWKDYTDNLNSKKFEKDFIINGLDYINEFLIVKNTIPNASAVVFKKETYDTDFRSIAGGLRFLPRYFAAEAEMGLEASACRPAGGGGSGVAAGDGVSDLAWRAAARQTPDAYCLVCRLSVVFYANQAGCVCANKAR